MSQITPDSWIERHWLDEPVDPSYNACREGECTHYHCDGCARIMPEPTDSGHCFVCDSEWNAAHQLTDKKEPRVCYCGQMLFDCAIKCPSRAQCHVENVQRAALKESQADLVGVTAVLNHLMSHFQIK